MMSVESDVDVCFFLQNKMCPFLKQGVIIHVGHSILWNAVELFFSYIF